MNSCSREAIVCTHQQKKDLLLPINAPNVSVGRAWKKSAKNKPIPAPALIVTPPLLRQPLEVLLMIVEKLPAHVLCVVRLVNKFFKWPVDYKGTFFSNQTGFNEAPPEYKGLLGLKLYFQLPEFNHINFLDNLMKEVLNVPNFETPKNIYDVCLLLKSNALSPEQKIKIIDHLVLRGDIFDKPLLMNEICKNLKCLSAFATILKWAKGLQSPKIISLIADSVSKLLLNCEYYPSDLMELYIVFLKNHKQFITQEKLHQYVRSNILSVIAQYHTKKLLEDFVSLEPGMIVSEKYVVVVVAQ